MYVSIQKLAFALNYRYNINSHESGLYREMEYHMEEYIEEREVKYGKSGK